ncbi:carboxymuconolactone decarboxylase family protein [Pseudomonas cavernicola]|uniref:Carboxymuconolactone decarboxylase family protein n=1 Tax=Pseudomonas cavernicola TaxID=2320866 RepID=A0A418X975_9PSED|nr:carboxymuconolactone decarboxylase family protein [Pseudomonas cavernicola]RJG08948.1 carboxymuconolactone decarboxylase family protein [Pseudomonas cavernicola]
MHATANEDQSLKPATPIIDRMRASGQLSPSWDSFARLDPQWTEQFLQTAAMPVARGLIDPKTYEFLAIAVNASCTHMYSPGVRRHTRNALKLGASPEEILAVLQSVSMLGIQTCSLGTPILLEEMAKLDTEAE